jgi:gluconokinase
MVVMVMGVTGSGKTTVGGLLAKHLGWEFADADDFHSASSKEKIKHGVPLTDADRVPWLAALHHQMTEWIGRKRDVVLACSGLKQSYREELWTGPEVQFAYLKGTYETIHQRLLARKGHFADEQILASQFATLEEPTDAIAVEISSPPEEIVAEICRQLGLVQRASPYTTPSPPGNLT